MKIVIVGGVAGGAGAAARARRLDEDAEIVMFERGEFISFANCGLPYHVGEVIEDRSDLLLMTPETFRARTAVDVRVLHEVTDIERDRKMLTVRNLRTGEREQEGYDKLILATGSSPIRPPIPGADDPDVLQLWTIPDMDRIKSRVDEGARRAIVVGGGFIGLEIAENLRERDVEVELVEMLPQVLPTVDPEMAQPLAEQLTEHGVNLRLGRKVQEIHRPSTFEHTSKELVVVLDDGTELSTDFVVMCIGVRPNSELASEAGLSVGKRGAIQVDQQLRTDDPDIYAVGDVIEVTDLVEGGATQIPLAGPANRQARIVAANVLGGEERYEGSLGTSVVQVFERAAGSVGATEKALRQAGRPFAKTYLHPFSNAAYYPGGAPLSIKLLFEPESGRILGAQCVGSKGVDKRVDVIATVMKTSGTVHDLADLELAYAPPYGSAKDPVNYAGMIAENICSGRSNAVSCEQIPENAVLLDVRQQDERDAGHIPKSLFIPLGQLRDRLDELPRDKTIIVYCKVGLRGYLGERILKENGFDSANLSGGWITHQMMRRADLIAE